MDKSSSKIDQEQIEFLENAQKRIRQKKLLYYHFIIFLFFSSFLFVLNFLLNIGNELIFLKYSWSLWIFLVWCFLILFHAFDVYVTNRFLGKKWKKKQTRLLMELQRNKILELKKEHYSEAEVISKSETFYSKSNLITIIAAADENNVIGKENKLIWHLSDDLKHFKNLTKDHHVIMGRKTFESMPKALPNRTNIVITRNSNYVADNVTVVSSLNEALEKSINDKQPFIIGGGEIYKLAMEIADRIELTRVHHEFDGDTYFPQIDPEKWIEVQRDQRKKDLKHNYDFTFIRYDKKR
ncbi:MAG: dihydrofolate reductase [Flavobacteriaceae bacterium]|nr:dihydrofolate reductase [Flavobacteriaceae bacterium]MBL6684281.1 dihydrofolate reductase [Flavobacteriaceae bacterium]